MLHYNYQGNFKEHNAIQINSNGNVENITLDLNHCYESLTKMKSNAKLYQDDSSVHMKSNPCYEELSQFKA